MGAPEAKPRLRGWSHAFAAVGAVAATVALCWRCGDDPPRVASMLVYGLSMGWMFAVSATYHLGTWRPARRRLLRALDHASIFVLIAGTYTPVAFNALAGWERPIVLGAIWILATIGMSLSASTRRLPRWATPALYVGMGWAALVPARSLAAALPGSAVAALVGGGVLYTIGALVYVRRWPDPLPRVFGFHEVFHVLVIGGAATFAAVIWIWMVTFPRA